MQVPAFHQARKPPAERAQVSKDDWHAVGWLQFGKVCGKSHLAVEWDFSVLLAEFELCPADWLVPHAAPTHC